MTAPSTQPLSTQIEAIRHQLFTARSAVHAIMYGEHSGWKDRVDHVHGLLTCGIVALAHSLDEVITHEVAMADRERGPSLSFRVRGIGLDSVPCCFVCGRADDRSGRSLMANIAAFVSSKEEGETIVGWFRGRARLDYRPSEPSWLQVKIGACDEHKPVLERLAANHGRIRQADIEDLMLPMPG